MTGVIIADASEEYLQGQVGVDTEHLTFLKDNLFPILADFEDRRKLISVSDDFPSIDICITINSTFVTTLSICSEIILNPLAGKCSKDTRKGPKTFRLDDWCFVWWKLIERVVIWLGV